MNFLSVNEFAESGGDAMPWYFKRAGVGKLIGERTWGGLVGRPYAPPLMDGGLVSAPSSGVFNPTTGQWEVENVGVAPDLEVELDPKLVRQGKDPQLEKAVEVLMAKLARSPLPAPKRPPTRTTTREGRRPARHGPAEQADWPAARRLRWRSRRRELSQLVFHERPTGLLPRW